MMKDHRDEQLIWKYMDRECPEEEKIRVEERLTTDPSFKTLYAQIQKVHLGLSGICTEGPSMRFAENVLQSLPLKKVYRLSYPSFSGKISAWIGSLTLVFIAISIVASEFLTSGSSSVKNESIIDVGPSINTLLSHPMTPIIYSICIGGLFLFLLDHYLANRRSLHHQSTTPV